MYDGRFVPLRFVLTVTVLTGSGQLLPLQLQGSEYDGLVGLAFETIALGGVRPLWLSMVCVLLRLRPGLNPRQTEVPFATKVGSWGGEATAIFLVRGAVEVFAPKQSRAPAGCVTDPVPFASQPPLPLCTPAWFPLLPEPPPPTHQVDQGLINQSMFSMWLSQRRDLQRGDSVGGMLTFGEPNPDLYEVAPHPQSSTHRCQGFS